jgi:hypothetical protein
MPATATVAVDEPVAGSWKEAAGRGGDWGLPAATGPDRSDSTAGVADAPSRVGLGGRRS